ncbi:hypothetical protein RCL1_007846 [Eukaryota sp. TZLM3-RCL]
MLGTLTNEAPVESVDYSRTTARDFSFLRLTHNHWTKQDRTNRGILERAKEHCFDPQKTSVDLADDTFLTLVFLQTSTIVDGELNYNECVDLKEDWSTMKYWTNDKVSL